EDDALIGVRSTARLFGERVAIAIAGFYAGAVLLFAAALAAAGAGWAAYAGLAAGAVQLAWQAARPGKADPASALRLFRSNRLFGLILLAGLVADAILTAA